MLFFYSRFLWNLASSTSKIESYIIILKAFDTSTQTYVFLQLYQLLFHEAGVGGRWHDDVVTTRY